MGFFDRPAEATMAQVSADRSITQSGFTFKNQHFSIAHREKVHFLKTSASDCEGQTIGAFSTNYCESAINIACICFVFYRSYQHLNLQSLIWQEVIETMLAILTDQSSTDLLKHNTSIVR